MTRDECSFLLGRISRIYGRKLPDGRTVDEWHKFLADTPVRIATDVLDHAVRDRLPGPSLPGFLALVDVERKRRTIHDQPPPQQRKATSTPTDPNDEPVSKERALWHISRIREQLAGRNTTGRRVLDNLERKVQAQPDTKGPGDARVEALW